MATRRNILKTTIALPAILAGGQLTQVFAKAPSADCPEGIVYTKEKPGKWSKKIRSHAPMVSIKDGNITLETVHGMSEEHYIVRHTLVTESGKVIGEKTFYPKDKNAVSTFKLPENPKVLYATSFCNKHDLWLTRIEF